MFTAITKLITRKKSGPHYKNVPNNKTLYRIADGLNDLPLTVIEGKCPSCKTHDTRPSKPHITDSKLRRWLTNSYRCRSCKHRYWRLKSFVIVILLGLTLFIGLLTTLWLKKIGLI